MGARVHLERSGRRRFAGHLNLAWEQCLRADNIFGVDTRRPQVCVCKRRGDVIVIGVVVCDRLVTRAVPIGAVESLGPLH
jgi:hypothetical protein